MWDGFVKVGKGRKNVLFMFQVDMYGISNANNTLCQVLLKRVKRL